MAPLPAAGSARRQLSLNARVARPASGGGHLIRHPDRPTKRFLALNHSGWLFLWNGPSTALVKIYRQSLAQGRLAAPG